MMTGEEPRLGLGLSHQGHESPVPISDTTVGFAHPSCAQEHETNPRSAQLAQPSLVCPPQPRKFLRDGSGLRWGALRVSSVPAGFTSRDLCWILSFLAGLGGRRTPRGLPVCPLLPPQLWHRAVPVATTQPWPHRVLPCPSCSFPITP